MKLALFLVPALGVFSASGALTDEFDAQTMDFRSQTPISLSTTNELLPLAWTSAKDWSADGAAGVAARLVVAEATGSAVDITTWISSGEPSELVSTTGGEGVATWTPTRRGLYLVTLLQDDVEVAHGYVDLTQAAELADKKSLAGCTVELEYASTGCTGFSLTPTAVVKDGGTDLVADVDYLLFYTDNLHPGTATVTLYGIGAYKDSLSATFAIVPVEPTPVVSGERVGPAVAIHPGGDAIEIVERGEFLPIAYNDGETFPTNGTFAQWPAGGHPTAGVFARVSVALLESADSPLDEASWFVLNEATGEGTFNWHPKSGWSALKLEIVRDGAPDDGSLVRLVHAEYRNGMVILIR